MKNHFYIDVQQGDDIISLPFLEDLSRANCIFEMLVSLKTHDGAPALDYVGLNHIVTAAHDSITTILREWRDDDADTAATAAV